jgi:hypothetical protein
MKIILLIVSIITCSINLFGENYAFLISAGYTLYDGRPAHSEYWYDLYLAYEDLIEKEGYSHENVIVFYGNGSDFSSTISRYQKDYNGWENDIVDENNSFSNMNSVFEYYGENVITDEDNILIRWVVGHGLNRDPIEPSYENPDNYYAVIENLPFCYLSEIQLLNIINQIEK